MDFKVIFRETFLADLEAIIRLIAVNDPEVARRFGESILTQSENLSFFPERYPKVRQRPGIRRFIAKKNFKIFYHSISQTVFLIPVRGFRLFRGY